MFRHKTIITALIMALALSAPAAAENYKAVAGNIKGTVQMSTGSGSWKAVKNHDKLRMGDKVKTGADGSVILSFGQGNVLALSPLTSITIEDISSRGNTKSSVIRVESGRMLATARKLKTPDSVFEVRTPHGSAGVRGSEVAVTVDQGKSLFQIVSGVFTVTVGGVSELLQAGFQMDIAAGLSAPPAAAAIDPAVLEALKKEVQEKTEAGKQTEANSAAEDNAIEAANDVFEILDRANHGSCRTVCSYFSSDGSCMYIYEMCEYHSY